MTTGNATSGIAVGQNGSRFPRQLLARACRTLKAWVRVLNCGYDCRGLHSRAFENVIIFTNIDDALKSCAKIYSISGSHVIGVTCGSCMAERRF